MITVDNMFQAHEIALAARAMVYRLKNGYLVTHIETFDYPFVTSFKGEQV